MPILQTITIVTLNITIVNNYNCQFWTMSIPQVSQLSILDYVSSATNTIVNFVWLQKYPQQLYLIIILEDFLKWNFIISFIVAG